MTLGLPLENKEERRVACFTQAIRMLPSEILLARFSYQ